MKLRRIEREGKGTEVRVMLPEKLAAKVSAYQEYYAETYEDTIDLKEFGLLAFEAIVEKDQEFKTWLSSKQPKKEPKKLPVKPLSNGKDEARSTP